MEKSFDFGKLLQNNKKKHKNKPMQFVSVSGGVKKRLENDIKKRKTLRLSVFDRIRNLPKPEYSTPVKDIQSKVEHRRMQLEKWKEEKEKKKKEASLHKKKPFIVGVAHNALKFVPPPPPKAIPSTSGRVTRSQSARISNNVSKQKITKETKQLKNDPQSFAPKNAMFNPVLKNLAKPKLEAPKKTEKKNDAKENTIKDKNRAKPKSVPKQNEPRNLRFRPDRKIIKSGKDFSPVKLSSASCIDPNTSKESLKVKVKTPTKSKQNNKFSTPKNIIPKSESSSEERLRSPKPFEMLMTPQQIVEESKKISPCVTLSRGKDNARREMKNKLREGLLDDDLCQMESVESFRQQLHSEIKRMTEMCDTWEKISEQIPLPETVQEAVLAAVGQARLLMAQKLQQFAALLLRCERPAPGQALVTPGDLHGFWDMVFMQIVNVDMRFRKLEELRARGWAEAEAEAEPARGRRRPAGRPPGRTRRPAVASRLRDVIAAARKAKKDQVTEQSGDSSANSSENKTFEAGFFCVQSPVKSPKPSTPLTKTSLLKAVLSSEAQRASASKSAASRAMLRASLLGKSVESDVCADAPPLTPINLGATPARSILKSNVKSSKKSIKVVLFNNSNEEVQETLNKDDDCQKLNTPDINSDVNADLSSMDTEDKENKSRRKLKLVRQEAFEDRDSCIMTRSRRKSIHTPKGDFEENTMRKKLQEVNGEEIDQSPRRSRRKSVPVKVLT